MRRVTLHACKQCRRSFVSPSLCAYPPYPCSLAFVMVCAESPRFVFFLPFNIVCAKSEPSCVHYYETKPYLNTGDFYSNYSSQVSRWLREGGRGDEGLISGIVWRSPLWFTAYGFIMLDTRRGALITHVCYREIKQIYSSHLTSFYQIKKWWYQIA